MPNRDVNININGKDNFTPAANAASRSAVSLKTALGGLNTFNVGGAGLGTMFSVAGLGAITGASIKLAAGYEQTNVAFKTMLKSGSMATDLLGRLSKFAQETPFQFSELTDASKKLLAFGVAADDIVPTLTRLGDVSSAIGAPIGEIAELYGKARVQGRLFAEDVNQFTGRGIPLIQELAKQFGTTDDQVKKLVETGQVGFRNLEQAFVSMTGKGGQFSGMMVEQSRTLLGQWSSLKDTMEQIARTIGGKIIPGLKTMAETIAFGMGGDMPGVPKMVGQEGGLFAAGLRRPEMLKAGRDIINQRDAIAAGKRALLTEKDPARRAQIQAQIDAMEGKQAGDKAFFANGIEQGNAFRAGIGARVSGALNVTTGLSGLLGGAFDAVKGGTEMGVGKLGKAARIAELIKETRTPQEKFDAEMAKLRAERGDIGDDLFNRKRKMLEDDLSRTFDKNDPVKGERFRQERLQNAPLTEARFLTSAPGYASDPAAMAKQQADDTKESKEVQKQQLVVLRAMERKLQRQTRLGVL